MKASIYLAIILISACNSPYVPLEISPTHPANPQSESTFVYPSPATLDEKQKKDDDLNSPKAVKISTEEVSHASH